MKTLLAVILLSLSFNAMAFDGPSETPRQLKGSINFYLEKIHDYVVSGDLARELFKTLPKNTLNKTQKGTTVEVSGAVPGLWCVSEDSSMAWPNSYKCLIPRGQLEAAFSRLTP